MKPEGRKGETKFKNNGAWEGLARNVKKKLAEKVSVYYVLNLCTVYYALQTAHCILYTIYCAL